MLYQIAQLAGGLGLFLLGMRLMTEGLKVAAGPALRDILSRFTGTRWRGLASGFAVTALVQSSGAVTVAVIGFVNAGLMSLSAAVWVVFGSNVGTTVTGWLVALIGLNIQIEALALPMIAAGVALRVARGTIRRAALGDAIVGFGIFFLGISVLKSGFEGVGPALSSDLLSQPGWIHDAILVGIGLATTVLTQSSSATIAIALAATAGGLLPLEPGAAMVIGANLGTTSTGLFAVIGATPAAKRVAAAHVTFNLIAAVVAFALLPWVVLVSEQVRALLNLGEGPATVLALFHTIFNTIGVLLMWPLADRLVRYLATRFVTAEEIAARPRYLGRTPDMVPALAVESLRRELWRLIGRAILSVETAIGADARRALALTRERQAVEGLIAEIQSYITKLYRLPMAEQEADALEHGLRVLQHCEEMAALTVEIAEANGALEDVDHATREHFADYRRMAFDVLNSREMSEDSGPETSIDGALQRVEESYQALKRSLLAAGATGELRIETVNTLIDLANMIRQACQRALKSARRMRLFHSAAPARPETVPS